MKKNIPQLKSEKEERDFWQTHDSTEYVDWKKAERIILSNLKPSAKIISLRLPEAMLEELKLLANKRDVPYQSLVKVFLSDRIEQELTAKGHNRSLHWIAKKTGSR
jgi:predicted DNA binding CopG/RHH family protein